MLMKKNELEPYKNCKYNTSIGGHFVGYCQHPHNYFDDEHGESLCHETTHDIIWDTEENQFRLIKIESEYWLEELEEPEVNLC